MALPPVVTKSPLLVVWLPSPSVSICSTSPTVVSNSRLPTSASSSRVCCTAFWLVSTVPPSANEVLSASTTPVVTSTGPNVVWLP